MQGCLAIDSSPASPLTFVNRKVKIYANCLEHHAPAKDIRCGRRNVEVFHCIPHGARALTTIDHVCSAFLRQILLRMKELGISQTDLAKRMRVSRPYISKVLRQDVNFSFRTAAKLARALKMDFFPDLRPQESSLSTENA